MQEILGHSELKQQILNKRLKWSQLEHMSYAKIFNLFVLRQQ